MAVTPFVNLQVHWEPGPQDSALWRDESTADEFIYRSHFGHVQLVRRNTYPVTDCLVTGSKLTLGYGEEFLWAQIRRGVSPGRLTVDQLADEYFLIELDIKNRTVRIWRDAFCTLPVFYSTNAKHLIVSNRFEEVLDQLKAGKLTIDNRNLSELLLSLDVNTGTLFEEISLLGERTVFKAGSEGAEIVLPTDRPKLDLETNPEEFAEQLDSILECYLDKAYVPKRTVFEVSAGIDSTTMPGYAARHGFGVSCGSMEFPGDFGNSQRTKLVEFTRRFTAEIYRQAIDPNTDYPLARIVTDSVPRPFYQYSEIYSEPLEKLASHWQERNTAVVFTGIGGDELFETLKPETENLEGPEEVDRRRNAYVPDFYLPRFKAMYERTIQNLSEETPRPTPLLARSAWFSQMSRNNVYIERGIWPVAPLSDPVLLAYCQALPAPYRLNKAILRTYQQFHRYPELIYRPAVNEHFGTFFENSLIAHYGPVIKRLTEDSRLAQWGLVNPEKVRQYFENIKQGLVERRRLFCLYEFVAAELIFQSLGKDSLSFDS